MNIYAVNLTTDTKSTDIYDKVAVNKYPIIVICKNRELLKEKLKSKDTEEFVRNSIRHQNLFDNSIFYIREICDNDINEFTWKVNELLSIQY